jgi:hypothetical protein
MYGGWHPANILHMYFPIQVNSKDDNPKPASSYSIEKVVWEYIAIGLAFGVTNKDNAVIVGFGMHMLTSVLIAVIFGVIIAKVDVLRITGFAKEIIEGLITGMIAFVVLFIPISMGMMPPVLMKIAMQINPAMSQQQIMAMMQQKMPMMFGIGVLEHLVYGAVLGAVTTALLLKVGRKIETQMKEKEEWK